MWGSLRLAPINGKSRLVSLVWGSLRLAPIIILYPVKMVNDEIMNNITPGGVGDCRNPECHHHDDSDDKLQHILVSAIPPLIVGLLLIIAIIVVSCWCCHRRRRSREMAILTEKGELIVVKDDGKHAERHGPLVIRLSQLESRRV
jgi:hypothetical protein